MVGRNIYQQKYRWHQAEDMTASLHWPLCHWKKQYVYHVNVKKKEIVAASYIEFMKTSSVEDLLFKNLFKLLPFAQSLFLCIK